MSSKPTRHISRKCNLRVRFIVKCSYLVEIDDREESDWLFKTFVEKGNLIVLECFFTRIKFIYNQYHTIIFFVIYERCLFQQMCSLRRLYEKLYFKTLPKKKKYC